MHTHTMIAFFLVNIHTSVCVRVCAWVCYTHIYICGMQRRGAVIFDTAWHFIDSQQMMRPVLQEATGDNSSLNTLPHVNEYANWQLNYE